MKDGRRTKGPCSLLLALAAHLGLCTASAAQAPWEIPPPLLENVDLLVQGPGAWMVAGRTGIEPGYRALPGSARSERVMCLLPSRSGQGRGALGIALFAKGQATSSVDVLVFEALAHPADHDVLVVDGAPWLVGPPVLAHALHRPGARDDGAIDQLLARQDLNCVRGGSIEVHPPAGDELDSLILVGAEMPGGHRGWKIRYSFELAEGEWSEEYEADLPSGPRQVGALAIPALKLRLELGQAALDQLFFCNLAAAPGERVRPRLERVALGRASGGDTYQRGGRGIELPKIEVEECAPAGSAELAAARSKLAQADEDCLQLNPGQLVELWYEEPERPARGETLTYLVRVGYPDPEPAPEPEGGLTPRDE